MKFAHTLLCAAVCSAMFFLGANAQAQSKPGYATVVRIQGEARYSKGDNNWHPLVVGQTLTEGCVVQTAQDATLDLVLGEKIIRHIATTPDKVGLPPDSEVRGLASYRAVAQQNVIHMSPGTVLAVDKLTVGNTGVDAVSDTELDLRQGTIFGNVKKLSAASQYTIKIPNGIAGVRGTTFILSANGAITVVQGSMVLSITGANGQTTTVVLGPGDQYDPTTGQTTQLTPQEFAAAARTAVSVITIVEGVISFADDRTRIFVSPTHGRPPGSHHGGGGGGGGG